MRVSRDRSLLNVLVVGCCGWSNDTRLYFEEVEHVFREYVVELRALYFFFCGETSKRMNIAEWLRFVKECGLTDTDFNKGTPA